MRVRLEFGGGRFREAPGIWRGLGFGRVSGSHRWLRSQALLWGLILTLAYRKNRLNEEEKEKKRDPVGGQTALLIYSEGRGLDASDPLPFL